LVGSICDAKASPEVAAIFSPASITAPKQIASVKPQVKPMNNSCNTIGSKSELTKIANDGNFILLSTQIPIPKEKTILTGKGTIREPKKGDDRRKGPILRVEINNNRRYVGILCKLIPG